MSPSADKSQGILGPNEATVVVRSPERRIYVTSSHRNADDLSAGWCRRTAGPDTDARPEHIRLCQGTGTDGRRSAVAPGKRQLHHRADTQRSSGDVGEGRHTPGADLRIQN